MSNSTKSIICFVLGVPLGIACLPMLFEPNSLPLLALLAVLSSGLILLGQYYQSKEEDVVAPKIPDVQQKTDASPYQLGDYVLHSRPFYDNNGFILHRIEEYDLFFMGILKTMDEIEKYYKPVPINRNTLARLGFNEEGVKYVLWVNELCYIVYSNGTWPFAMFTFKDDKKANFYLMYKTLNYMHEFQRWYKQIKK